MAVIETTDKDFKEQLDNNSKVIIKFFADWCGSCKLFAPKYKRVSNDEKYNDVTFLEVNAENNPEARKLAGVDNLPFFATFKDGKLLEGSATSKEEYLVKMLENLKS